MSVEIDWQALTTGPDGQALAESIRDFIHAKFQDVKLPKFIRAVKVHSFEFGEECPQVVLKDICDPLDEFYESDEDSSEEDGEEVDGEIDGSPGPTPAGNQLNQQVSGLLDGTDDQKSHPTHSEQPLLARRGIGAPALNGSALSALGRAPLQGSASAIIVPTAVAGTSRQHPPGLRTLPSFVDQLASPLLHSRAATPGIPGGTANLSYFHHAPFPHHQPTFPAPWSDYNFAKPGAQRQGHTSPGPHLPPLTSLQQSHGIEPAEYSTGDPSTRPSTATTQTPLSRVPTGPQETQHEQQRQRKQRQQDMTPDAQRTGKNRRASRARDFENLRSSPRFPSPSMSGRSQARPEPNPTDMQLVLHVRYSGGIRLALSAEILLDYPMSSFVSIPLQLTITGVSFDGVAIVAHVRPPLSTQPSQHQQASDSFQASTGQADESDSDNKGRAHICFLSPEDARALLGADARDLESEGDGIEGGVGGSGDDFAPLSPPEAPETPETERRRSRGFDPASPPPDAQSGRDERLASAAGATPDLSRASTMLSQQSDHQPGAQKRFGSGEPSSEGLGGLLREIRVESEIGQRRDGQHSLRNVGKVERFVLEQVRRIFEDEFVWPSFWTFLL